MVSADAVTSPADTRSSSAAASGPRTASFAMKLMSIRPTPSRIVRCSVSHSRNHGARPHVGSATGVPPGPENQSAPSQPETSRR